MKDFIPKGTGNSRYMKTSLPTGTTWEQALAMLRAGTFPFDLNGVNAAGVAQMGDGLNTATFWPEEVAALFGLGAESLPKDGFSYLGKYAQHWWKRRVFRAEIETGEWEYVQSSDRDAYPDSGVQDGYEYQYIGIPFDNAVTAPKIATGSYVGTGAYGASNSNSLTFGFEPKLVIVYMADSNGYYGYGLNPGSYFYSDSFLWVYGQTKAFVNGSGNPTNVVNFTSQDTELKWYNASAAAYQLNTSGQQFDYIAIG